MGIKRKVYYWIVAGLAALMFVLSFVGVNIGLGAGNLDKDKVVAHINQLNTINASNRLEPNRRNEAVVDYIVAQLSDIGLAQASATDTQIARDYEGVTLVNGGASFLVQKATVNASTAERVANANDTSYIGTELENVVVAFPGTNTGGDTLVFNVAYDAPLRLDGAMSANADVAIMLEAIRQHKEWTAGNTHTNNVVFVFGQNNVANLGMHAFANQFAGFGRVASRATLGVGLRGLGTSGNVSLLETSDNNFALLSQISLSGTNSSSWAANFVRKSQNFINMAGLNFDYVNFGNTGDMSFAKSPKDSEIFDKTINQKSGLVVHLLDGLRSADISASSLRATQESVVFNYLGINVILPVTVYVIFGVILLLGVVGLLALGFVKKVFSLRSIFGGMAVQLLTLAGVVLASLVAYYVFGFLFVVAYGGVPINLLNGLSVYNPGILIAFMLFGLAAVNVLYGPIKKAFRTKGVDVVRGNVFLLGILAAILAFAVPTLSYPFVILAVLQLVVMLISTLQKKKYKDKYGSDIERLFLYAIPVILTLPLTLPAIISVAQVAPLPVYSILAACTAAMFGFVTPYLSFLKPKMDKVFAKLPGYNLKVVTISREEVEDKSKKGKFSVETVKKLEKKPTRFRYHAALGTSVVAIIAGILLFVSSTATVGFATRIDQGQYHSLFQNGMVLAYEKQGSQTASLHWEVRDQAAWMTFNKVLYDDGFDWDSGLGAFVRQEDGGASLSGTPEVSRKETDGLYEFQPARPNFSQIDLTVGNASAVRSFEIILNGQTVFTVDNNQQRETVKISLPYSFGNLPSGGSFQIQLKGAGNTLPEEVVWQYTEYSFDDTVLNAFGTWLELSEYFDNNMGDNATLRGGVVYRVTL